jgi:hypothetical protein
LWLTQYAGGRGRSDDYDTGQPVPGYGYAIPNRVMELLEAFRRPPGVA